MELYDLETRQAEEWHQRLLGEDDVGDFFDGESDALLSASAFVRS